MGHHHRRRRSRAGSYQDSNPMRVQDRDQQDTPGPDLGAMLQNLNLGDVDLSKVDMNKVQTMVDNLKQQGNLPANLRGEGENNNGNLISSLLGNSSRGGGTQGQGINLLRAFKEVAPQKKAHKLDRILKLLQLTETMNGNSLGIAGFGQQQQQSQQQGDGRRRKKHHR